MASPGIGQHQAGDENHVSIGHNLSAEILDMFDIDALRTRRSGQWLMVHPDTGLFTPMDLPTATGDAAGMVRLSGDLGGTSDSPSVVDKISQATVDEVTDNVLLSAVSS